MNKPINRIAIVCKRELIGYFSSPLAYIFIIIFLLLTGFFTFAASPFGNFLGTDKASLSDSFFSFHPWLFLILVPPIAMRLWSEELKSGTNELLFTMPIRIFEAVIGKFLAAWIILGFSLLLTFPYVITVNWLGSPDNGVILVGYLGSFLLAGSFLSIGCMTSSITKNQIISFIFSIVICFMLVLAGHPAITDFFINWTPTWITTLLGKISVFPSFELIQKGIINFSDILYFISIIFFCLFTTRLILQIKYDSKTVKSRALVSIIALLIILLNMNFLAEEIPYRYDVTQDKLYTLSSSTKNILHNLNFPVTIRFYYTRSNKMPVQLRLYAKRVEDLIKEYVRNSNGNINYEKYNPIPDTDAETSAVIDGIKGQQLRDGNNIYLGLTVSCLNHNSTISFLSPINEKTLEYDITRSIYDVTHPQKPTLGVISSMPVTGGFSGVISSEHNRKSPWIFMQELQDNFYIKEISYSAEKIDDDIDILLIIHPDKLLEKTEFAIDQYLLKGGKLFVFVDPYCFAASISDQTSYFTNQPPPPSASSLPNLFKAWGIKFSEPQQVVIAPDNAYHALNDPLGKEHPAILNLTANNIDNNDIVMSGLNKLNLIFAGAFNGDPIKSLTKTILLQTASNSIQINSFTYRLPTSEIMNSFSLDKNKKAQELIIRLAGNFVTAFPEGINNKDQTSEKPVTSKLLNKSVKPGAVILVSDADMLFNSFCVSMQKVYDRTIINVINSNLGFVTNAADQLSGDLNIINIRTRGAIARNFTRIEKFYDKAKKKYQAKITLLENELKKTEDYLNKIQASKTEDKQLILTEKQLKAIQQFREDERKIKKQLTSIRKKLRNELYTLKLKIEILNIVLVPLLLIVLGSFINLFRFRRKFKIKKKHKAIIKTKRF